MENCDNVTEALIREYLSKNGLDHTLKAFEQERPRGASSITNRNVLRKALGMEKMVARMKKKFPDTHLPPTIEILVGHQLEKAAASDDRAKEGDYPRAASMPASTARAEVASAARARAEPQVASPPAPPPKPRMGSLMDDEDQRLLQQLGGMSMQGTMSHQTHAMRPGTGRAGAAPPPIGGASFGQRAAPPLADGFRRPAKDEGSLMMEDVDDFEDDFAVAAPAPSSRPMSARPSGRSAFGGSGGGAGVADSLDPATARQARQLLFGCRGGTPPDSWKQGFFFTDTAGLEFGLHQDQGGPCGVLAAVQAHILLDLLPGASSLGDLRVQRGRQESALAAALARALWQAGGSRTASVVSCSEHSTGGLSLDQVARAAKVTTFSSLGDLERFVAGMLPQYQERSGWGLVMFLLSAVLSRGAKVIEGEMDDPAGGLMGAHGYCTQDMVNLIIVGRAISNVFDGEKVLDSHTTLRGVPFRSKIGLLTLFEWYQYVEVGDFLKRPEHAVWVVCSESHFTTIFSLDGRALRDAAPFDLLYYDGLAMQDALIRLSVRDDPAGGHTAKAGNTIGERGKTEGNLTPPLEYVIETRWPGVKVDWNGADPIL